MCPLPESPGQISGVNIAGSVGSVGGDIVGGNKTINVTLTTLQSLPVSEQGLWRELHNIVNIDDSDVEANKLYKEIASFVWESQQSGIANETDFIGGYATVERLSEALSNLAEDGRAKHNHQRRAYVHFLHGCLIIIINALDNKMALEQFELACRIDPNEPRYFHVAGEEAMKACRYRNAENYFTDEIRLLTTKASSNSGRPLWRAYNSLGGALDQQHLYHEAIACFEKAAELLLMEHNEPKDYKDYLGLVRNNLGGALAALGLFSEARIAYADAEKLLEGSKNKFLYRLRGLVMNNKAEVERQLKSASEAERILHDALVFLRRAYSKRYPNHPIIAKTYNNLGAVQLELQLANKAKENLEEAVRIYDANDIPDFSTDKIISLQNLAQACWGVGELYEADSYYNRAMGGAESSLGNNDPMTCAIREEYETFQKARAMSSR